MDTVRLPADWLCHRVGADERRTAVSIPASVKVMGVTYTIEMKDRITTDGRNVDGEITYNSGLIEIVEGMPLAVEQRVVIHELIHAVFCAQGHNDFRMDENLVDAVANGMVQLLQDNPDLAQYLFSSPTSNQLDGIRRENEV